MPTSAIRTLLMDAALRSRIQAALTAKLSPYAPFAKGNLCLLFCVVCEFLDMTVRRYLRSHGEYHPLMKTAVQEELNAFVLDWMKQELPKESSKRFPPETLASVLSW